MVEAVACGVPSLPFRPTLLKQGMNACVWDARRGITKDGAGLVSQWDSQHRVISAAQATGASQPKYYQDIPNGELGYASFGEAGGTQTLVFPAQSNAFTENRWVLWVIRVPSFAAFSTNATPLLFTVNGNGGSNNNRQPGIRADKNAKTIGAQWNNAYGFHTVNSPAQLDNTWIVGLSRLRDKNVIMRANGVLGDSTTSSDVVMIPNGSATGLIGSVTPAPFHLDYLATGPEELTDDEASMLEWFGASRRGIVLPANHPYVVQTPIIAPVAMPAVLRKPSSRASDLGLWSVANQGTALDLSAFKQTFMCNFTSASDLGDAAGGNAKLYAGGLSDYAADPPPGRGCDAITWGAVGDAAYNISGGKCRMTARHPGAAGTAWASGSIQSVDNNGNGFRQRYGAFRWRMSAPLATDFDAEPRKWMAAWLKSHNFYTNKTEAYSEKDVIEAYEDGGWFSHATLFIHKADRPQPDDIQTDANSSMYNENANGTKLSASGITPTAFGLLAGINNYFGVGVVDYVGVVDPVDGFKVSINGFEMARHPILPEHRTPLYMMASNQLLSDRMKSNSAAYVTNLTNPSLAYIDVYEMSAFQRDDWAALP